MSVLNSSQSPSTVGVVSLVTSNTDTTKRRSKTILDEETYTEEMEKIVTRDFFPHVTKLKAQINYLDALNSGDMAKLSEIQHIYRPRTLLSQCGSSRRIPCDTPSTFGTPDILPSDTPRSVIEGNEQHNFEVPLSSDQTFSQKEKKPKSLDQFLAGATSEDNTSFEEIREKDAALHRQKYPWLYKDEAAEEEKMKKALALPSTSSSSSSENAITWTYKNKNALMYVPDGVEYTAEEKLTMAKQQEVSYTNTRFASAPFDEKANKEAIAEAASYQAKMKEGKVGIDGKEIVNEDSPQVNGYGFVNTPSPEPGVCDTPLMTWGEIEGTPFRLDGSDTPLTNDTGCQQFKMPEIPEREKIALSLADKVAKRKRQTKKDALKHAQSSWLTPSPRFGSASPLTPSELLQSMSPAAQKLASRIHKPTDKALRVSYTPSPLRTPQTEGTPDIVRSSPLLKTPDASPYKKTKISSAGNIIPKPQRRKAQDFF